MDAAPENIFSSPGIYCNEYGETCKDVIDRISVNPENGAGRYEKITIADDGMYLNIYKECATGFIHKNQEGEPVLSVENYNYVTSDAEKGEYIQSGGVSQFLNAGAEVDTYIDYGYHDFDTSSELPLSDEKHKKKVNPSLEFTGFTIDNLRAEVILFENNYQLPYTETLGFLSAFFSTWTYAYPLECYAVIDCERKLFNIPRIRYLPGIGRAHMRDIYCRLVKEAGRASEYIFRVLDKERRRLKILVFLHPFGSVIRLKDLDAAREERFSVYAPDQVQSFMKNAYTLGIKFLTGESLGILREGLNKDAVENALDCCDAFTGGDY
jgi:hypothetical protein